MYIQNDKTYWNFFIVKYLHKLSLKYPYINDTIRINGLNLLSPKVIIYGGVIDTHLKKNLETLESMMKDKPSGFIHYRLMDRPLGYRRGDAPIFLKECFELYKGKLRNDNLDDLLGIE